MTCDNCGRTISNESKFCRFCGAKNSLGNEISTPDPVLSDIVGKQESSETTNEYYAGFWTRFGAYFIDFIFLVIFAALIELILELFNLQRLTTDSGVLYDYFLWFIYNSFFLGFWSTTPGKKLYGLHISNEYGGKVGLKMSVLRSALQPFSFIFFGAGYWNLDKRVMHQAWHDKYAHTVVLMKKKRNYIFQIILTFLGIGLYLWARSLK